MAYLLRQKALRAGLQQLTFGPFATERPAQSELAMHQVKIFRGQESNLPALEKEVNTWLAESSVRVVQIFGNLAPLSGNRNEGTSLAAYPDVASDVLMVILYEKN